MGLLLILVLALVLAGSFPRWKYSRDWGYGPSSVAGILLVAVLLLMLINVVPPRFNY